MTSARPLGILFDMDGTLIDSAPAFYSMICETCRNLRLPVPGWEVVHGVMNFAHDTADYILPSDLPDRAERVRTFREEAHRVWQRIYDREIELHPRVPETLRHLREEGHALALVTSSRSAALRPLQTAGLLPLFDAVVTAEDVRKRKPDPEPVLLAVERLGLAVADCLLVGDTPLDMRAGQAAGVRTVGVLSGTADAALLSFHGADSVLERVADLPRWLEGQGAFHRGVGK